MSAPLLVIGCGKMGGALLRGWLGGEVAADDVVVVEPAAQAAEAVRDTGVRVVAAAEALPADFAPAIALVAVKPQAVDAVAPAYARFVASGTAFLSIAAGKTIGYFEARLGAAAAIVRAMPNTPAAVGRGVTVLCANANVSGEQADRCAALMAAVGEVGWVEDESLMDAVTGLSGSGPAYVFLLIECLARAGAEAGLPEPLAGKLAYATVCGAGELAFRSGEPASRLRENVTSPGGTTQAALEVLMAADGLEPLMIRAVAAATRRSRELAD